VAVAAFGFGFGIAFGQMYSPLAWAYSSRWFAGHDLSTLWWHSHSHSDSDWTVMAIEIAYSQTLAAQYATGK